MKKKIMLRHVGIKNCQYFNMEKTEQGETHQLFIEKENPYIIENILRGC